MRQQHHALKPATPGTEHWLTSLHFGAPGRGPKAFIQASLHADEVPGMLVAWHLRRQLAELQNAGRLLGEVVLVPAANPPGLSQFVLRGHQGRFDLASGENFNRGYADLTDSVAQALAGGPVDVPRVRAALRDAVAALPAPTLLASLRKTLFALAVDADIVLDLHCDGEALLHGYTTPGCWPQAELLAACMGWHVALLAERSGGDPFDEACSMVWPQLAARLGQPLPQACMAVTIELRGEADVDHETAAADALAIVQFLHQRGLVQGTPTPPPPSRCRALPLAGSMPLPAPHGGVVVFARAPGAEVQQGDLLAEVIDPITQDVTPVTAPTAGLFFARDNRRFVAAGASLGKVAGTEARRSGSLLSP